jgi:DNA-binding MltR family transcriptional regulator
MKADGSRGARGLAMTEIKLGRTPHSLPRRSNSPRRNAVKTGAKTGAFRTPHSEFRTGKALFRYSFCDGRLGHLAVEYAEIIMGQKKPKSATIPDFDLNYFKRLINESDRGFVLLITTRIDELLKELHQVYIKSKTSPNTKLVKELFAVHAPISTLSARIKLAFGYGLISKEDYDDLELLRDMRNGAAHTIEEFSFRQPVTRNKIVAFTAPKRVPQHLLQLSVEQREAMAHPNEDEHSTKLYFLVAGMCLNVVLTDEILKLLRQGVGTCHSTAIN